MMVRVCMRINGNYRTSYESKKFVAVYSHVTFRAQIYTNLQCLPLQDGNVYFIRLCVSNALYVSGPLHNVI